MVWAYAKRSEEQRLTARMLASTVRLNRHKDGVNILERLRIVGLQNPSLFAGIILVEDSEIARLVACRDLFGPRLETIAHFERPACASRSNA